jgi:hypothetical protein
MCYYASKEYPWVIYWIQFNGSKLADFLLQRGFHESSVWQIKNFALLERFYLELLEKLECKNVVRPEVHSALAYSVLVVFTTNAIPFSSRGASQNFNLILDLFPLMQQHATLPYILEE